MRIAICEDNEIHRDIIKNMLNRYSSERSIPFDCVPYEYGMNFLYDMEEGAYFDVSLLDIYMEDSMGNEIAQKLRVMGYQGKIVFLTASPDYAIESYDVAADGYLLKPLVYEKFKMVMDRIAQGIEPCTYWIRQRTTVTKVLYHEILYIESQNSKCILHTASGAAHIVYKPLNLIEKELGNRRFLRCHQSFLVNMDHIKQIGKHFLLFNGDIVPIRQRDLKQIRQVFMDYADSKATAMEA